MLFRSDAERKLNPGNQIFEAINKVSTGISVASSDDLKTIAEEILEYDELIHAKITLSLEQIWLMKLMILIMNLIVIKLWMKQQEDK